MSDVIFSRPAVGSEPSCPPPQAGLLKFFDIEPPVLLPRDPGQGNGPPFCPPPFADGDWPGHANPPPFQDLCPSSMAVPEPSGMLLLVLGLVVIAAIRRLSKSTTDKHTQSSGLTADERRWGKPESEKISMFFARDASLVHPTVIGKLGHPKS